MTPESPGAPDPERIPEAPPDLFERVFVWGLWSLSSVAALAFVWFYGTNLPYMDDWDLVPVLSGAEPISAAWVWAQSNEHRFPLSRLILFGLIEVTGGDWRAATFVSVALLSTAACLLIVAARRVRGRAGYADAFFPIALLNWGHYYNLLFPTQVVLGSTVLLACTILVFMLDARVPGRLGSVLLLAVCLILLPLHGGMGLVLFPGLAVWAAYAGWGRWHGEDRAGRRDGALMLLSVLVGCALVAIYFINFSRPSHHPAPRDAAGVLGVAAEFLAVGVGPVGAALWPFSGVAVVGFLSLSLVPLLRALRARSPERLRAAGLLLFIGSALVQALAVGYGRSGLGPAVGLHERYYILSAPLLCCLYFVWILYRPPGAGRFATMLLFTVACAGLSLDVEAGVRFGRFRVQAAEALRQDIRAGATSGELAERYSRFIHPDKDLLAGYLEMLRRTRRGPFAE